MKNIFSHHHLQYITWKIRYIHTWNQFYQKVWKVLERVSGSANTHTHTHCIYACKRTRTASGASLDLFHWGGVRSPIADEPSICRHYLGPEHNHDGYVISFRGGVYEYVNDQKCFHHRPLHMILVILKPPSNRTLAFSRFATLSWSRPMLYELRGTM